MKYKLYSIVYDIKRTLIELWYWLLSPIAYFYTREKMRKRYEKKRAKITEGQAIKWIAEDIVRYVIKNKSSIEILICDYASKDHFDGDCTLNNLPYYIKRYKTRMAFWKFKRDVAFQEKIVEYLKKLNVVQVIEEVEQFKGWQRIDNYQKTVIIKTK